MNLIVGYGLVVRIGIELGRITLGTGGLTVVYMSPKAAPFTGQRFVSLQYHSYCRIALSIATTL